MKVLMKCCNKKSNNVSNKPQQQSKLKLKLKRLKPAPNKRLKKPKHRPNNKQESKSV
ncbi:Uncharacterised protein [Mycobacteroides abscessus subsp. abscessus]|nr:Uncharacterised protein [Mycobacteroides abscessus subsp. abscessus]